MTCWKPALQGTLCPTKTGWQGCPRGAALGQKSGRAPDAGRLWGACALCGDPPPCAPYGAALPGWQLLIHNIAPAPLPGSDEAHSSSRVVLVPGLPGKPNPCPQEAASQQRLQKAPTAHGPSTQQHGQPDPAPHGKSFCPSTLPCSLKEGFNAWLAAKACPPPPLMTHTAQILSAFAPIVLAEQGWMGAAVGPH